MKNVIHAVICSLLLFVSSLSFATDQAPGYLN